MYTGWLLSANRKRISSLKKVKIQGWGAKAPLPPLNDPLIDYCALRMRSAQLHIDRSFSNLSAAVLDCGGLISS